MKLGKKRIALSYKGNGIIWADSEYARITFDTEMIGIYHPGTVVTHLKEIRKHLRAPAAALAKTIINIWNDHRITDLPECKTVTIIPEQVARHNGQISAIDDNSI